jgi:hypothetical protein
MKTFTVHLAQDVPHYGSITIKAESSQHAFDKLRERDLDELLDEIVYDPAWENYLCPRIVSIDDEHGNSSFEDTPLGDTFLRYGGKADRLRCDAASDMLDALHLARRELQEFYTPEQSEALRVVTEAITKAEGGAA